MKLIEWAPTSFPRETRLNARLGLELGLANVNVIVVDTVNGIRWKEVRL